MQRKFMLVLAVAVALAMVVSPVYAKGNSGQAGKSNVAHLYLDPYGDDPEEPYAWGKVKYNLTGCTLDFVFNGHELIPGTYYGMYSRGVLLGFAMANEFGDVHIKGSYSACAGLDNGKFNLRYVTVIFNVDDESTQVAKGSFVNTQYRFEKRQKGEQS